MNKITAYVSAYDEWSEKTGYILVSSTRFVWGVCVNGGSEVESDSTYARKSDAKRGALRFMKQVAKAVEQGVMFED